MTCSRKLSARAQVLPPEELQSNPLPGHSVRRMEKDSPRTVSLFARSLCAMLRSQRVIAGCLEKPGCLLNFFLSPPPQNKHTAAEGLEKQYSLL